MSDLRRDPVSGRWVIVATERARRAEDFRRTRPPAVGGLCPFCPGNERLTPPEVFATRPTGGRDTPGWQVRVVPNRAPALRVEGELEREGEGLFDRMRGVGAHEVLVPTPDHERGLAELTDQELERVLRAFAERLRDLSGDRRLRAAMAFVNEGVEAGSTMEHAHGQVVALPIVPKVLDEELDAAEAHWQLKERCLFCDIVRQERRDAVRLVDENDGCVVLAPWASRAPFEQWVLPKAHGSHFERLDGGALGLVAQSLGSALRRLDVVLERPAFHLVLHSAPLQAPALGHYHWHFELRPAIARVAGFEWGSGLNLNPVAPEEAAEHLRRALAR